MFYQRRIVKQEFKKLFYSVEQIEDNKYLLNKSLISISHEFEFC